MARIDATTLQIADGLLLAVGAVYALWCVRSWMAAGPSRDPLQDAPQPPHVSIGFALLLLAAYGLTLMSGVPQQVAGVPRDAVLTPGNDAWQRSLLGMLAVQMCFVIVIAVGLRKAPNLAAAGGSWMWTAAASALAAIAVCHLQVSAIGIVWRWLDPAATAPPHDVLRAIENNTWGSLGVGWLAIGAVLMAPLYEEMYYRGVLLPACVRAFGRPWLAIVFTAGFFGLMHLSQPQAVLPLTTFGIMLGYLRLRSGALWVPILVHMLFNARTMALAVLNPDLIRGW